MLYKPTFRMLCDAYWGRMFNWVYVELFAETEFASSF